jgi:hypothetical protein
MTGCARLLVAHVGVLALASCSSTGEVVTQRGGVDSLTLGITVNCPYGLAA